MKDSKFPKLIDYQTLKDQFEPEPDPSRTPNSEHKALIFKHHHKYHDTDHSEHSEDLTDEDSLSNQKKRPGLTGTRLRSYAFAVLTRKEYSKKDLIDKLMLYAEDQEEVLRLVDELSRENYQSDQRVAEMIVRSQIRKGKGPNRIKLALKAKSIDKELAQNDLNEIDWYEEAYQLKVKKYGPEVSTDPKVKAKQIRFLQYRGFEMDAIFKAITRTQDDF